MIIHDLLDYHSRYEELFSYCRKVHAAKLNFFWIDLKGHGLSSGVRGHVESFDEYCWDVIQLINIISKNTNKKTYLLGQGLGALICLKMMGPMFPFLDKIKDEIAGLIFINPLIHFNFRWPDMKMGRLKSLFSTVDRFKVSIKIKGHQLCNDPDKSDEFDRDPLTLRKLSLGLIGEVIQAGVDVRRMSYFIDHPSLFLISQDDFLISPEHIILYQKGLPKEASSTILYDDARHDLFNDKDRELVFNDIIRWIEEQT